MTGSAKVIRGDARNLPLADASVDLICTSPPYFALRSYQDNGQHYDGQIGSEASPREFVDALLECTREWMRVLKPSGSIWVNLGDKYAGSAPGRRDAESIRALDAQTGRTRATDRRAPEVDDFSASWGTTRPKSLIGIPWRYAIRCIDDLGLILRAEVVWSKPNGLPESVTDRVRRSHEQWFHFTKQPRYFSAVDEIREPHAAVSIRRMAAGFNGNTGYTSMAGRSDGTGLDGAGSGGAVDANPLGKLPGSVWTIPTEPLRVPDHLGVDHFAAFPTEWPRRIIRGWSPAGVCVECGEGRRPVVSSVGLDLTRPQARRAQQLADQGGLTEVHLAALLSVGVSDTGRGKATQNGTGKNTPEVYVLADEARAVLGGYSREFLLRRPTSFGYACACTQPTAPTRPSVVLDSFGGTGTTALVAKALGRTGISTDMSADYCRLAQWRTNDPDSLAKAMRVDKPPREADGQIGFDFEEWSA